MQAIGVGGYHQDEAQKKPFWNDMALLEKMAAMQKTPPPILPINYAPTFTVRKIRNGFILHHARGVNLTAEEDYCDTLEEVGQRVTAILVQHQLENDK